MAKKTARARAAAKKPQQKAAEQKTTDEKRTDLQQQVKKTHPKRPAGASKPVDPQAGEQTAEKVPPHQGGAFDMPFTAQALVLHIDCMTHALRDAIAQGSPELEDAIWNERKRCQAKLQELQIDQQREVFAQYDAQKKQQQTAAG